MFIIVLARGVDKGLSAAQVSPGFSDLSSIALFRRHYVQYEKAGITLFSAHGCCDASQEEVSNHYGGNKKDERCICLGRLVPFSQCGDG